MNETLHLPRSSSADLAVDLTFRSDSSFEEEEHESSLHQIAGSFLKDEGLSEFEGRIDGKQKRKRTSPRDQAILEAEYKNNPKPNKAMRAEIVEKVSLNEKEVQIWFQNRRQINRRKSRPLLPHEIAAFGLTGMTTLSSDPAPMLPSDSSSQSVTEHLPDSQEDKSISQEELGASQTREHVEGEITESGNLEMTSVETSILPPLKRHSSFGVSANNSSLIHEPDSVFKSFTSTPGYLANRWNSISSSSSTPTSSQAAVFVTPTVTETKQPSSCPERMNDASMPSSHVRLSMSLDGKAELVTSSPSPPRVFSARPTSSSATILPRKRRSLQRSQSALPFATPPHLGTGRSRDARSWEFCCDADARDELTTQAERESNGSAVAAISLLRSTSSSVLRPNTNKRNAPTSKKDTSKQGKKVKLERTQSSVAVLQNPEKSDRRPLGSEKDGLMRSPSGDSDKENWLPGDINSNSRRRPLPSARVDKLSTSRAILGDNLNVPTHALGLGGSKNRNRKGPVDIGSSIFTDRESSGEVEEEVEKFMRGELSPSKKGDFDCIQGLLSLSQGDWR